MVAADRPAGDLFAEVQIMIPANLDEAALAQLREIDARFPLQPRRDLHW